MPKIIIGRKKLCCSSLEVVYTSVNDVSTFQIVVNYNRGQSNFDVYLRMLLYLFTTLDYEINDAFVFIVLLNRLRRGI